MQQYYFCFSIKQTPGGFSLSLNYSGICKELLSVGMTIFPDTYFIKISNLKELGIDMEKPLKWVNNCTVSENNAKEMRAIILDVMMAVNNGYNDRKWKSDSCSVLIKNVIEFGSSITLNNFNSL